MRVLDVEIGYESDFHPCIHVRVGVHRFGNGVDELNDALGHEIAGCSLAAEDECARWNLQIGILFSR